MSERELTIAREGLARHHQQTQSAQNEILVHHKELLKASDAKVKEMVRL